MRRMTMLVLTCFLAAPAFGQVQLTTTKVQTMPNDDLQAVSPALARYNQDILLGKVWARPGLSRRDRSIVTLATLIARNQTGELRFYLNVALDAGLTPKEISEVITHLAFYAGWPNGLAAVAVAKDVFATRGIDTAELPKASPQLLPPDKAAEEKRAKIVDETVSPVSPGLVEDTGVVLFRDLWLRPDLTPRDRSLVTVAALIANGQVGQIPYHLGRAMDNGLTQKEVGETLSHIAYYAGWPNAFSAVPVVNDVFESRAIKGLLRS